MTETQQISELGFAKITQLANKVDKEAGKSLVLDSELARLASLPMSGATYYIRNLGSEFYTDITTALQTLINTLGSNFTLIIPDGEWTISGLSCNGQGINLVGQSKSGTVLRFLPSADGYAIRFGNGTAINYGSSISNMTIYTTDTTRKKVGLLCNIVSGFTAKNLMVKGFNGNDSVALQVIGHELSSFTDLILAADIPLRISRNPLFPSLCADHFNFNNIEYLSNTAPSAGGTIPTTCILIDADAALSNTLFTGVQALVRGHRCVHWVSTSSVTSLNVRFDNLRWEQEASATGYLINAENNVVGIQDLHINMIYGGSGASGVGGSGTNGIRLRGCSGVNINGGHYLGGLSAIDIDNTCTDIGINNFIIEQNAATISLTAFNVNGSIRKAGNVYQYRGNGKPSYNVIQADNPSKTLGFSQYEPKTFAMTANSSQKFADNTLMGIVQVTTSYGTGGQFFLKGTANAVSVMSFSDAGWFGNALGAANINIYYDAATTSYRIQNNVADAATFWVTFSGRGER